MIPFSHIVQKTKRFLRIFGPGLVTGASDDDPSGIISFLQGGARFGFLTLWTSIFSLPMLSAMQEMSARIGLVTSRGLTMIIKKYYPKIILYFILLLNVPAIILNIGSDIQAIGAVANMLYPKIPVPVYCIFFTLVLMILIIKFPFQKLSSILKWLCLSILLYIVVPFMIKQNWIAVIKHTFIPSIQFNKDFLSVLTAILGTTISPYLFFWQATMEAEDKAHTYHKKIVNKKVLGDMEKDVNLGMFLSIVVMFFMMLTAGSVLFPAGLNNINSVEQAARALEPLTGKFTYLIFATAVLGTGFLTIPILASCQSYMLAESFGWRKGLDKTFKQAKGFNILIIVSLLVGLSLDFLKINPVKALLITAILYGLTSPFVIAIVLHIANNKKIMRHNTNNLLSNILGFLTLILMTGSAALLIYFLIKA
jgi:NRAMP (natural resistance-associated macrophage protein)-like metal ion transporter